ncbi:MAG: YitT family protein [Ruminococcaceae bacterium]|nr:YitT family protein [Oscillospiraceae bacterium]
MSTKIRNALILTIASILFAIGLNVFLVPSQIVAGGFTGLAIILNILFKLPVGTTVIILNIPFLIANAFVYGKNYIKRAFIGVMITGISSEILSHLEAVVQNRIFNATAGGAVMGVAMGLIFSLGYTTGGTDLIATLVRIKFKNLRLGSALFLCDLVIIILALIVTSDMYGVGLAFISIFIQSIIINFIIKRQIAH